MNDSNKKQYRPGACVVVLRCNSSKVLVCHRIGSPPQDGWQFPQGGINPKKSLESEALRELREETGIESVAVLKIGTQAFCYDFPVGLARNKKNKYAGQSMQWVLCRMHHGESVISFTHNPIEFDAFRWVSPHEAIGLIVGFKRGCYRRGLASLGLV